MKRQMVECEDGRSRQARVYGIPRYEGDFVVMQAGVRIKGKHVTGEAWHSQKSGLWYFLSGPGGKNMTLLPRQREKPSEPTSFLLRSPTVKVE